MEATEASANRHGPLGDRLAALKVGHDACRLDLFEGAGEEGVFYVTDHNERSSAERFVIQDGVWVPKIILAVAIAQGQADGIDLRMVAAIKAYLAGQIPGGRRQ